MNESVYRRCAEESRSHPGAVFVCSSTTEVRKLLARLGQEYSKQVWGPWQFLIWNVTRNEESLDCMVFLSANIWNYFYDAFVDLQSCAEHVVIYDDIVQETIESCNDCWEVSRGMGCKLKDYEDCYRHSRRLFLALFVANESQYEGFEFKTMIDSSLFRAFDQFQHVCNPARALDGFHQDGSKQRIRVSDTLSVAYCGENDTESLCSNGTYQSTENAFRSLVAARLRAIDGWMMQHDKHQYPDHMKLPGFLEEHVGNTDSCTMILSSTLQDWVDANNGGSERGYRHSISRDRNERSGKGFCQAVKLSVG